MNTTLYTTIWLAIISGGAISWLLRGAPLLFIKSKLFNENNIVFTFLTYSSFAVLGSLIYSIAFDNKNVIDLFSQFNLIFLVKALIIILTFVLSCLIKNAVIVFFINLILYALLLGFLL